MIEIACATALDALALSELERLCFSEPWSEKGLRETLSAIEAQGGGCFLAARENGEIVGYGGMLYAADAAGVTNVAVSPDHRRRGIGRALMLGLIERAGEDGMTVLQLEVRQSGTAARALYESLGFVAVGRRKGFYRYPTEDAILMDLPLAEPKDHEKEE